MEKFLKLPRSFRRFYQAFVELIARTVKFAVKFHLKRWEYAEWSVNRYQLERMFLNSNFAGTGHAKNRFDNCIYAHLPSIRGRLEIRKLSPVKRKKQYFKPPFAD